MSVLVTGFGPFGEVEENPSAWLAENCGQTHQVLDVSYRRVDEFLAEFDPFRYRAVLMIGVAARRKEAHLELLARNWQRDAPDTEGDSRPGVIDHYGPTAIASTLWTTDVVQDLLEDRLQPHGSAGGFICNYLAYRVARLIPNLRTGFLHVPPFDRIPAEDQLAMLGRIIDRITD